MIPTEPHFELERPGGYVSSLSLMEEKLLEIAGEVYHGTVLKRGFLPDLTDWQPEGPGQIRLSGDRMIVDAPTSGFSVFWKTPLPADILVRYCVRSLPPYRQNNFNLISHCSPPRRGWPIVEGGRYPGYREFPNYIVTFVGDWEEADWGKDVRRGRIRFRRNPGFELKRERQTESIYGRPYHMAYVVKGGTVRYHLDGQKMEEWQDPEPLPGGFFAIRTFCTTAEYWDLEILALDQT